MHNRYGERPRSITHVVTILTHHSLSKPIQTKCCVNFVPIIHPSKTLSQIIVMSCPSQCRWGVSSIYNRMPRSDSQLLNQQHHKPLLHQQLQLQRDAERKEGRQTSDERQDHWASADCRSRAPLGGVTRGRVAGRSGGGLDGGVCQAIGGLAVVARKGFGAVAEGDVGALVPRLSATCRRNKQEHGTRNSRCTALRPILPQ